MLSIMNRTPFLSATPYHRRPALAGCCVALRLPLGALTLAGLGGLLSRLLP
jgi:hypothetical protein